MPELRNWSAFSVEISFFFSFRVISKSIIIGGKSVKYLLPEGVADYIRDKKLYL